MTSVLLALCCGLGCPLLMGVMWLMSRDREGPRLERELSRLNAEAEARGADTTSTAARTEPAERERLGARGSASARSR